MTTQPAQLRGGQTILSAFDPIGVYFLLQAINKHYMSITARVTLLLTAVLICLSAKAGTGDYWQQQIAYKMEIDFDVTTNQFKGTQEVTYTNHSPDTLHSIYYHLYFNAFQPGSMMDVRSRTIDDPDGRVRDRIFKLDDSEIGYHRINTLKQGKKALNYEVNGTILEVKLNTPILPGKSATYAME